MYSREMFDSTGRFHHFASTSGDFATSAGGVLVAGDSAVGAPPSAGEKIPSGGWRTTQDEYRTRDGRGNFVFRFVPVSSYFEIDIVSMPSYGRRKTGCHETHRLPSDRDGYRICFAKPSAISTLEIAYQFAEAWAENSWNYINTGARF